MLLYRMAKAPPARTKAQSDFSLQHSPAATSVSTSGSDEFLQSQNKAIKTRIFQGKEILRYYLRGINFRGSKLMQSLY